jgi:purine-binding chemotaxis protein CheW
MTLIAFRLEDKEYAVDITRVREIIRVAGITGIPDAAEFVEGVINLRGRVVPVISLRKKLGLQRKKSDRMNRIIITQVNSHFVGVLVDSVIDVISVEPGSVTPRDEVLKEARYLAGVGKVRDRLVLIMDLGKLLTGKERTSIEDLHERVELRKKKA